MKKSRILMELRPAFDGYAGIPQDTRNTYKLLAENNNIELTGHLLSSKEGTNGYPFHSFFKKKKHRLIERQSGYVLALSSGEKESKLFFLKSQRVLGLIAFVFSRVLDHLIAITPIVGSNRMKLYEIEYKYFSDYIWRNVFSKSLSAKDVNSISKTRFFGQSSSWSGMSQGIYVGLPFQRINTKDHDYYISQTPLPARVSDNTQLIVRYHDAIPMFMPHTISDALPHKEVHYKSLLRNIKDGALFVCNSEATKLELLNMFPSIGDRISVVHCCISNIFYPDPISEKEQLISLVINRYSYGNVLGVDRYKDRDRFMKMIKSEFLLNDEYLLAIGTMEPRKNYNTLLSAWIRLRSTTNRKLKLVIVGNMGWHSLDLLNAMMPSMFDADLYLLEKVPISELRKLYSSALATVVPSYGEGFSYSGIESMKCGGIVLASDIGVHKEIYKEGATYFNPYSTAELHTEIEALLESSDKEKEEKRSKGFEVASLYSEAAIGKQWSDYIDNLQSDAV